MDRMSPKYARIALISPIFPTYSYAVPISMTRKIHVGSRVVVPLGGGHANGVVLELEETCPENIRIKEILELIDQEPLIDRKRIELALWISHYYFAPPGECLRLFFPPGSYVDTTYEYHPTEKGVLRIQQIKGKTAFQDSVLALVKTRPGITRKEISRIISSRNLDRTLAALEKKELVRKKSVVLGARAGFRRLRFVELLDRDVDPEQYPVRQRAMLEFLLSHQGPHLLSRVVRESGGTHSVAQALQKKSLLRIVVQESYRDPFQEYSESDPENHVLTSNQADVVDRVRRDILNAEAGRFLLLGVTGSGKTQVYIELIKAVLSEGRTALVMVPEISLTPVLTRRFLSHFGSDLAILHSMLSDGERFDQWIRIRRGEARVVIGTRSSLFAPLDRLGLIVIDEEHDSSYKQNDTPRYHARDVARRWASENRAVLVLGSATPSLESFYQAVESEELELLELPERVHQRPLPDVKVVDMSVEFERHGKNVILAGQAHRAIAQRMKDRQQVMVLLNRRGFSPVLICRKCGATIECDHCSISMTYHRREGKLLCHYCSALKSVPDLCPECGSRYIFYLGTGTEKLEAVFRMRFAGRKVDRFDRDTTRRRGSMKEILDRFERREIDLLVGTQMIAKGHDFPGVTLVVVLSTDTALRIPDFRAAERTFQLLTQVAGRSGRGATPGEVYIQTYYPNHYSVRHARSQNYRRFYEQEIYFRRQLYYPPFTHLVYIGIKDRSEKKVCRTATAAGKMLREVIAEKSLHPTFRVLGPAPALLEKIKNEYRYSILIRCLKMDGLFELLHDFRQRCAKSRLPVRRITIDVDPLDLV